MSQQVFNDKYWPLALRGAGDLRPGVAILQTRDGKDEPITLGANMVWDDDVELFVPVSKDNPLPVEATFKGSLPEGDKTIGNVGLAGALAQNLSRGISSVKRAIAWNNDGNKLDAGQYVTILDTSDAFEILALELSGEHGSIELAFEPYNDELVREIHSLPHGDARSFRNMTFNQLIDRAGGETGLFKVSKGEDSDYYLFLKRPFPVPNGIRIRVRNNHVDTAYGAALLMYVAYRV